MATIWDVLTAAGTVSAAIGVFYGFRKTDRVLKDEKYAKYVERYEEIFSKLPYNIFTEGNNSTEDTPEIRRWMVIYIDLCAEELFDRQREKIDKKVWKDWAISIKEDFDRSALLAKIFSEVERDYPCLDIFLKDKDGRVPSLRECENMRESVRTTSHVPAVNAQSSAGSLLTLDPKSDAAR